MVGLYPLKTQVDKRKLMFLYKILNLPATTTCKQIFIRRYLCFITNEHGDRMKGFVPDACNLLIKYDLVHLLNNYMSNQKLPAKHEWKSIVYKAINRQHTTHWRQRIEQTASFSLFKQLHASIRPALLWTYPTNRYELHLARKIAEIWIRDDVEKAFVCKACEQVVYNRTEHILSECLFIQHDKDEFINLVHRNFNGAMVPPLCYDNYLKQILGGGFDDPEFLKLAFSFVIKAEQNYHMINVDFG